MKTEDLIQIIKEHGNQVEAVELREREALVSYSIEGLGEFVLTLRAQGGLWVVYANQPA